MRTGFSWFLPTVLVPFAVVSCIEEGDRYVVPYRLGSVTHRVSTGGSRSSGGTNASGGATQDSGSGGAPDSDVTVIDAGSGGAPNDGGAGGASGSGGTDGSVCGCPPLSPLTPCCTTQRTCGYIVGAACFPYVPGTGGQGAGDSGTDGRDAAADAPIRDASGEASPDSAD